MNASLTQRYERLGALIERQLQLVGEGRWDELEELAMRRDELVATLPAVPDAEARPMLERCALLNRRVRIELLRAQDGVLVGLAQVQRGQQAAHGYAPARIRAPQISTSA